MLGITPGRISAPKLIGELDRNDNMAMSTPGLDNLSLISGVQALACTVAHELNQHLALLKGEIELALYSGEPLDLPAIERMQEAIAQMADRIKAYQHVQEFKTIEPVPGIRMLAVD
jgi:hypothetical protein